MFGIKHITFDDACSDLEEHRDEQFQDSHSWFHPTHRTEGTRYDEKK